MWIFWSATMIRVRVAFSMAYLVFPPCPAIRPIARLILQDAQVRTYATGRRRSKANGSGGIKNHGSAAAAAEKAEKAEKAWRSRG